jgi:RNA ligase (TIGR02306 family)
MSSLIVEVCEIAKILPHPNGDNLEIAIVKGWQCIIKKGSFRAGDRCIYFPLDSILPRTLSDRLGVTKYLKALRHDYPDGATLGGRVGAARLRGVVSYGLLMACEDPGWSVGTDVAAHHGVRKWEPPPILGSEERAPDHPLFHRYTDIENWKNFPTAFRDGEEVVLTEKLHGCNSRVGRVPAVEGPQWMAGSHGQRRKPPAEGELPGLYWTPLTDSVKALLSAPRFAGRAVILFGEIYGQGVQDLHYGLKYGSKDYRAFDLAVDGVYLDHDEFQGICAEFGVATVPLLYRGPYTAEVVQQHTSGLTALGVPQIREGVVFRPVKERFSEELSGRLILKSISDDYVLRKDGTEYH